MAAPKLARHSSTIGARDLWRPRNKPLAILFDDCREFIPHEMSIRLIFTISLKKAKF
jgi:hypothetical protein